MCNTWSAYHVQHVVCHVVRRDSSATSVAEFKSHSFYLYVIGLSHLPLNEGRKLEYPEKPSDDELQKVLLTKAP